jgi:hypothetical protein
MAKRETAKQPKRRTPKQAPRKPRGPLPLLPVTISASLLQLPLEALRDPVLCPPGSEQQAFLLNTLIDAHNDIHGPMIRQMEALQTGRRKGAAKGQKKQQADALERGRKIAKIVDDLCPPPKPPNKRRDLKPAWAKAVEDGLAKSKGAAKTAYYRHLRATP